MRFLLAPGRAAAARRSSGPCVKAPRSSRSGVSHAVCRQGSSTTPSFAAGAPARASSRWSEFPSPADRGPSARCRCRRRGSAARGCARGASAVECRSNFVPRPTSSSERASSTSLIRPSRLSRSRGRTPRGGPGARVRPLLGAGRDEPDIARGFRAGRERSGERDQRPDARGVVVGPGAGGTLSVCAIAIRGSRSARPGSRSRPATGLSRAR